MTVSCSVEADPDTESDAEAVDSSESVSGKIEADSASASDSVFRVRVNPRRLVRRVVGVNAVSVEAPVSRLESDVEARLRIRNRDKKYPT